jgi:hypothetical protein
MNHRARATRTEGLAWALAAGLLAATACAETGVAGGSGGTGTGLAPLEVSVRVEELPGADRWRVRYRLSRAVPGLTFARTKHRFRVADWKISSGGARWGEAAGREVVRGGASGRPIQEVEFELGTDSRDRAGDYRVHYRMSDGGRLLSTSHFELRPLRCQGGRRSCEPADLGPDPAPVVHRWEFLTAKDRSVVLLDRVAKGKLVWAQPPHGFDVGTYVYFGPAAPQGLGPLAALLDPGLPDWMEEAAKELLPELFRFYTRMTGIQLDRRPLVLVSHGGEEVPRSGETLAHKGGALDGVMQLHASGPGWADKTDSTRRRWEKLLAHETFHFWNGLTFSYRHPQDRWLSEGAADYFSWVALRTLGRWKPQDLRTSLVEAANHCATRLGPRPLLTTRTSGGDHRLVYTCGATLHYLAERQLRAATRGEVSLGDLYRRMFEVAYSRGRTYSTYDFMEALHDLTTKPLASVPYQRMLFQGIEGGVAEWLARELKSRGVRIELAPAHEVPDAPEALESQAARLIAACDCDGRWSFKPRGGAIEYVPVDGCQLFRARTRVTHVQGVPLVSAPVDAYAAALKAADSGQPLLITRQRSDEPVHVRCSPERLRSFPRQLLRLED